MKLSGKKRVKFDALCSSLVGKNIEIIDSKIAKQIGIKGTLIHETANFLILDVQGSEKRYLKNNIKIKTELNGQALYMDGHLLFSTLHNRIKKVK